MIHNYCLPGIHKCKMTYYSCTKLVINLTQPKVQKHYIKNSSTILTVFQGGLTNLGLGRWAGSARVGGVAHVGAVGARPHLVVRTQFEPR